MREHGRHPVKTKENEAGKRDVLAELNGEFPAAQAVTVLMVLGGGGAVTAEEIAAVKALCDRASPGPWQACGAQPDNACACKLVWSVPRDVPIMSANVDDAPGDPGDVAFIAASRTLVPQLLAEIERLQAEVAAMRPVVEAAVGWHNLGKLDQVHISVLSKGEEAVDSAVDAYLESLGLRIGG